MLFAIVSLQMAICHVQDMHSNRVLKEFVRPRASTVVP